MSRRGRRGRSGNDDGWGAWEGGYMGAKVQKLQEQVQRETTESGETTSEGIFHGVSIHVNGYTKPSWRELKSLMISHGGVYHHYYRSSLVSHIIATNLPDSKLRQLTDQKVVNPKWITDSVDAGKLLPYQDYVTGTRKGQTHAGIKKALSFGSDLVVSTVTVNPEVIASSKLESPDTPNLIANAAAETKDTDVTSLHERVSSDEELLFGDEVSDDSERKPVQSSTSPQIPPEDISRVKVADTLSIGPTVQPSSAGQSTSSTKSGDANFVSDFYNNSRLHHLSTWGAEWRAYVKQLQSQASSFPARETLRKLVSADSVWNCADQVQGKAVRVIMHIDMDSFFVSVALRKRLDLKGKPVAVTHSRGTNVKERPGTDSNYEMSHWRSKTNKLSKSRKEVLPSTETDVGNISEEEEQMDGPGDLVSPSPDLELPNSMADIASCSYEARKMGVKNGMLFGRAKQLCPDLIPIPYDFEGYREVSQILYDTVASYTHDIEAVSCDEMLVDCTDLLSDSGLSPDALATALRQEVQTKTSCTCSAGLGPNILMARLATRVAKPNGQLWVNQPEVAAFVADKTVGDLPGVGWSISKKLQTLGVQTCGELQKLSLAALQAEFGPKTGQSLYSFCRGIDTRFIRMERERKSVSAEINYGIRFKEESDIEAFLEKLSEEVHSRLTKINMKCKSVTVKLKVRQAGAPVETLKFMGHGICDNITKSTTLATATDCMKIISKECSKIVKLLKIPAPEFRGIGIQLSRLENVNPATSSKPGTTPSILNFTSATKNSPVKPELVSSASVASPGRHDVAEPRDTRTPSRTDAILHTRDHSRPVVHATPPPLPTLATFVSPISSQGSDASSPVLFSPDMQTSAPRNPNTPFVPEDPFLPVASQLDLSCIQALPVDLQEELSSIYGTPLKTKLLQYRAMDMHPSSAAAAAEPLVHPLMLAQANGSPKNSPSKRQQTKKKSSPRKSPSPKKSRSPGKAAFKVPVGRPPGRPKRHTNPKKLDFGPRPALTPDPSDKQEAAVVVEAVNAEDTSVEATVDDVNLGGAVSLEEVKIALLEWIQSSDCPSDLDERMVVNYLAKLAQHRDLERVFLLMRFLLRKIKALAKSMDNTAWIQCYNSLVDQTQTFVRSLYGAKLKL